MLKNIGEKIKMVAVISFLLGVLASIIAAIVLFTQELVGIGFLVLVCGSIASWLSCIAFYGFGELIVATSCNNAALVEIHSKLYTLERNVEKIAKQSTHSNHSPSKQKTPSQTIKTVQPIIEKPIIEQPAIEKSVTKQPTISQPKTTPATAQTSIPTPIKTETQDAPLDKDKEQLYIYGVQMFERRSYQVAYNIFLKIPDYKNTQEYLEKLKTLV
jgi:hypothetical protein